MKVNMGGSTGQIVDSAKSRARQYKREKIDKVTREAQARIGQASGDAMSGFETAMRENAEGVGDFIERNTRSISGRGGGDGGGSDSAEANYSSSRSASKSGGQGGKKDSTLKGKKNKQNLSKRALIKKKQ